MTPDSLRRKSVLESVNYDLEKISGNIDKIAVILSKLFDLEGQDARSVSEGQRSMKDYVA